MEFQNQQAVSYRSLAFLSVDGRPHPVSGSMIAPAVQQVEVVHVKANFLKTKKF